MTSSDYDFQFDYPSLTKVSGEPDWNNLDTLKDELRANAMSVPSTFGNPGEQLGYIALVLTDDEYGGLTNTAPFVRPPYPGTLVLAQGVTQVQSHNLIHNHATALKAYNKCEAVERALKQQLVQAIESQWLEHLRNEHTNAITASIPEILQSLFDTHGDVSVETLQDREIQVKSMTFDPATQPVDVIFNEIHKLVSFGTAASMPYTQPQIVGLGYNILRNTRRYPQAIVEWNRACQANANHRTWMNFKTHFRRAHKELRESSGLVAADTNFQANVVREITDKVADQLSARMEEHLALIQGDSPPAVYGHDMDPPAPPTAPVANLATTPPDISAVLQSVLQMQNQMMQDMLANQNNNRRNNRRNQRRNHNDGGGRGDGNRGGSRTGRGNYQRPTPAYCWTHGWNHHSGAECRTPATGHKNEATVNNRMGGSTYGLPPST